MAVMACHACEPDDAYVLCETAEARVLLPPRPHLSPRDGGHLVAIPKRHVRSRRDLTASDLFSVELLTMVAADALEAVFGTPWFNYQENGNWSLDRPDGQHMHVHVYGRTTDAVDQPYGEALRFPLRAEVPAWRVLAPDEQQREDLRREAVRALARRLRVGREGGEVLLGLAVPAHAGDRVLPAALHLGQGVGVGGVATGHGILQVLVLELDHVVGVVAAMGLVAGAAELAAGHGLHGADGTERGRERLLGS
jgi:diadenosine tetraphosphate (Ap4A) HIT family hydrolase